MKIACIGWGSLCWNPDDLPVMTDWQSDGPFLPLEFARQSGGQRVTLVICSDRGLCQALWSPFTVTTLASAREALRQREKTKHDFIGHWSIGDASSQPEAAVIGEWVKEKGLDAAVWTALPPKFNDRERVATIEEVLSYLKGLQNGDNTNAEEYVRKAPKQIQTPYRNAIERTLGWISVEP